MYSWALRTYRKILIFPAHYLYDKLILKHLIFLLLIVQNGTASEYINNFFGGEFGLRGAFLGCLVLGCILTLSRIFTWVALKYIRFA